MNKQEGDIIKVLVREGYINQRMLAESSGYSLGAVNQSLQRLSKAGYVDEEMHLTDRAMRELEEKSPKNAIILAAGFGMRMIPINMEFPKGLLEVRGEVLIERLIRQLHEAGIKEIYVIVGFMKEKYEYLIDQFQVKLIVNPEYSIKNNLHSLKRALSYLSNTYIIPCDIWCNKNPFSQYEMNSWYMLSSKTDSESPFRLNRKREIVSVKKGGQGNAMIGMAYLTKEYACLVGNRIKKLALDSAYDNVFWEETLCSDGGMLVPAELVNAFDVVEINTYEQLREIDSNSNQLKTDAIRIIMQVLQVRQEDIKNISVLKKGMTNRSFLFECFNQKYIMRIPGEGTGYLINRRQEAEVYRVINEKGICDDSIYINSDNGYKISRYIENARVCNTEDEKDVVRCMRKLRAFHEMNLKVSHEFQLFEQIEFYESLWKGNQSVYRDYKTTKKNVFSLKSYMEAHVETTTLTHIDAVPDNFLFSKNEKGEENIYLIDWEYAGMQDPHVDIAMFCIYAFYDREQIDKLINIYFENKCKKTTQIKIYCYIAACGLLWSNWCEYKRNLGVDFGEYSLKQYRYAKEYYHIVCDELGEEAKVWGIR